MQISPTTTGRRAIPVGTRVLGRIKSDCGTVIGYNNEHWFMEEGGIAVHVVRWDLDGSVTDRCVFENLEVLTWKGQPVMEGVPLAA
jgi:hypothetical protein